MTESQLVGRASRGLLEPVRAARSEIRSADAGTPRLDRRELIELGTPLVRRLAFRFARRLPRSVQLDDLVSSGMEGLLRAADAYDPARNDRFEPYAERRIRGAMLDELRGADSMTRHGRARATSMRRAEQRLEKTLSRAPTEDEIAKELGVSVERYRQAVCEIASTPSLGRMSEHGADDVASHEPDPATLCAASEQRAQLAAELSKLPPRSLEVVALYYQHECTQAEIGQMLGVTESRVCQILGDALSRLRKKLVPSAMPARRQEQRRSA